MTAAEAAAEAAARATRAAEVTAAEATAAATRLKEELHAARMAAAEAHGRLEATVAHAAQFPPPPAEEMDGDARVLSDRTNVRPLVADAADKASAQLTTMTAQLASAQYRCELLQVALTDAGAREVAAAAAAEEERQALDAARRAAVNDAREATERAVSAEGAARVAERESERARRGGELDVARAEAERARQAEAMRVARRACEEAEEETAWLANEHARLQVVRGPVHTTHHPYRSRCE